MKLDLDRFYIEYNTAYRTLTLYQKVKGRAFGEDKGFIIVAENKISELNNFFAENTGNANFISTITALSKLFPLEGNFRKMISILNDNFQLNLISPGQHFFKSAIEIKAEANKELHNAFRSGNVGQVNRLLEQYRHLNLQPDSGHVAAAIQSGHIEGVKFLAENFDLKPKDSSAFMYAVESKSLQMLDYLYKTYRNLYFTLRDRNDLSWAAARTGDINILRFCVETLRLPIDTGTLYDAVSSKKIDLVKYLVEEKHIDIDEALEYAQRENLQDISHYLESTRNITVNSLV